jgi:nucleoid DNA-binding protein
MNKPTTLSIKNFLIRKMAVDLMIPEASIRIVIDHQFENVLEALRTEKIVEISGLGKFIFFQKRADKKYKGLLAKQADLEAQLSTILTPSVRRKTEMILNSVKEELAFLKPRINEPPPTV